VSRRPPATALSCAIALACAVLLAAGCGSSGSGGSSAAAGTTTAAGGTGTQTSSSGSHSELKADGTPKYASPSPSEPAKSGTIEVAYRNLAIAPDTVRAKVGSTVRWTNEDPQKCNVTSQGGPYKFSSGDIQEGGTFELKLDRPGTIHYECTYFPVTMNGTIEVVG
jgi:plastocyanin